MKESGWGSFSLEKGISTLGKNDKMESSHKVGLKKWNLEALEKERTKVSHLRPLRTRKPVRDF